MSSVGYDLDTSGGLMPLIRALIKPPDDEGNGQKAKKPQHPYYKRPGKGHNHDSCDACGEGGDLICCDRCPASFHLGCYDPPLEEKDIPEGSWLCRECKASDAEKPTTSRGSRAVSPADSKSDTERKTRSLRNRSNSKKRSKDESDSEEEKKEKEKEEEEENLTPMEVLVKAARIMNPTQFQLPTEMQVPCVFPGTDKEGTKNSTVSVVTTDSNGCVPLPAKACYVCLQTCKHAPLLQCDYCPLLFHLDCLDPPLTALPTGRWMCPNHVEKFIDWKLVNSISMTERVALWDRFQAPVDQHAIKIDFIRRARNRHPRFRVKQAAGARARVRVPGMVRAHYAAPPPLLPSRREYVRCSNALKRLKAIGAYSESEDEDAPKHTICMNLSCPEYTGEGHCEHSYTKRHKEGERDRQSKERDRKSEERDRKGEDRDRKSEDRKRRHSEDKTDDEQIKMEVSSDCSSSDSWSEWAAPRRRPASPLRARAGPAADRLLADVGHQLRNIDDKLLRILAWQRLQQVLAGEQLHGAWRDSAGGAGAAAARLVAAALGGAARRGARPRPSELLSAADRARIAGAVWGPAPRASPAVARMDPDPPAAQVRAALCPTQVGSGECLVSALIPMRLSQLSVGTDSACRVRLRSDCRAAAGLHARIFMDEVTRHFELINYSEYGSVVNGVMYACDGTSRAEPAGDCETEARAAALRAIVSARAAPAARRVNGSLTLPPARACRCRAPAPGAAWEGSALLPHGALLQFGCSSFVFSITDALPDLAPAEPHAF